MSRNDLPRIGIYIVIILAMLKIGYEPLSKDIDTKRQLLNEKIETYSLKKRIYDQETERLKTQEIPKESLSCLYPSNLSQNTIRARLLTHLVTEAEKKGLSLLNFELPEAKKGKNISEVSVLLRLKGKPKPLFEYLSTVESHERLTLIRSVEVTKSGEEITAILQVSVFRSEI